MSEYPVNDGEGVVLWSAVSPAAGLFRSLLVTLLHSGGDPHSLGLARVQYEPDGTPQRLSDRIHAPRGQSGGGNPARDGQWVWSPAHCCWWEHVALRENRLSLCLHFFCMKFQVTLWFCLSMWANALYWVALFCFVFFDLFADVFMRMLSEL